MPGSGIIRKTIRGTTKRKAVLQKLTAMNPEPGKIMIENRPESKKMFAGSRDEAINGAIKGGAPGGLRGPPRARPLVSVKKEETISEIINSTKYLSTQK